MIKISKRDNTIVTFDKQKIIDAINKAFLEVDGLLYENDTAKDIADEIEDIAYKTDETSNKPVTVEQIQDLVEDFLMQSERRDVAKAYIRFRYKKEVKRNLEDDFIATYKDKISGENDDKQNANVDGISFGGRMGAAADEMHTKYALNYIISNKTRENHENNIIYIHDRNAYAVGMHNCLTIPIDDLAKNGCIVRGTRIIRPCGSFASFGQLSAVWMQLQSLQQFGGVSYSHYDWSSVPYVRKSFAKHFNVALKYICEDSSADFSTFIGCRSIDDEAYRANEKAYQYAYDMTEKEVHQTVEALYHNLNTLQSRSGNQLPFSSINYGTCTLPEGRMVIKALLEVSIEGMGTMHTTSIFPCGIFQCMKGVNREPGDPNYDLYRLALESTSKRLYPNYANVDWTGNAGYDRNDPKTYFSTMGCRTANGYDINGFGQLKDGRGNIAPTTIILPTIAMLAVKSYDGVPCGDYKRDVVDLFMQILDEKIHEAKDSLIERFDWICSQPAAAAKFMYENNTMAGYVPEEGIRSALKHGTLAIGQLGLAETLQLLIGCDHTEPEGMELAKRIEGLFKQRCAEFKEEYKLNFGVYYTPRLLGLGVA